MRRLVCLVLPALILGACATSAVQKPRSTAAKPQPAMKAQPAAPPRPRWQAVPARADGAAVPGGRRHLVKRGETGIAIAQAYAVPWSRIAAANSLSRDAVLRVGQPLFIPAATAPPPRTAGPRPAPAKTAPAQTAGFALDIDDLITGSAPARDAATAAPRSAQAAALPPGTLSPVPALAWPVDGRVILSRYGPKTAGRFNDGVNIKTLRGSAVRAAADGEILYVGDAIAGFGLMILIRHPGGAITAYGHLDDALADRGDTVQRGQPIASAGTSGTAPEPQLHFQLRQGRKTLDPLLYLPR